MFKFEIGQWVRILDVGDNLTIASNIGKVGLVISHGPEDSTYPYHILFYTSRNENRRCDYREDELELFNATIQS